MFTFNKIYFSLTIVFFVIEVLIAFFVHDSFVRPYLGDILVVILIYCFIQSFIKSTVLQAALFTLIFSFTLEFLQFINSVEKLHLENNKIAKTIIGTSFSWMDLLCYLLGFLTVIVVEKCWFKKTIA